MAFAIYRTKKLKTIQSISGSANHMMRKRHPPNADPDRLALNRTIYGSEDALKDVLDILPKMGDKIDGLKCRRINSVLVIEVLMTASPEFWEDISEEDKESWLEKSKNWLIDEYGEDNIAHLELHMDNTSPNLMGFIVPLKEGKLNAYHWLGGREKKSAQQTTYAKSVESLGLERGLKGSIATHQTMKQYYSKLAEFEKKLKFASPPDSFKNKEEKQSYQKKATEINKKNMRPYFEK